MKNLVIAVSSLLLLLQINNSFATSVLDIKILCPTATGSGSHVLNRYVNNISGAGEEFINGSIVTDPVFSYRVKPAQNIPLVLATGQYNQVTPQFDLNEFSMSCKYDSSVGYASFTAIYPIPIYLYDTIIVSYLSNGIDLKTIIG